MVVLYLASVASVASVSILLLYVWWWWYFILHTLHSLQQFPDLLVYPWCMTPPPPGERCWVFPATGRVCYVVVWVVRAAGSRSIVFDLECWSGSVVFFGIFWEDRQKIKYSNEKWNYFWKGWVALAYCTRQYYLFSGTHRGWGSVRVRGQRRYGGPTTCRRASLKLYKREHRYRFSV